MEKYQRLIYDRIEENLHRWKQQGKVEEPELYRFFHNLKGTAGTIGMKSIHDAAAENLNSLDEHSPKVWSEAEWHELFQVILPDLTYTEMPSKESPLKKPLVLIVDDEAEFAAYLKDMLQDNGYEAVIAVDGGKGIELFYKLHPSLVILDYFLPEEGHAGIFEQMVKKARQEFTPVIALSASADNKHKIRAYDMGITDFLGKPINKELFLPFLNNRLEMKERIRASSLVDELTGAGNLRFMDQELAANKERLQRGEMERCTMLLFSLRGFRNVNETFGYEAGDAALTHFVHCIDQSFRDGDAIFRIHERKFALLLPQTAKARAQELTKQLRAHLHRSPVPQHPDLSLQFSAVEVEVTDAAALSREILTEAERLLWEASSAGKQMKKQENPDSSERHVLNVITVDDDEVVRDMMKHYLSRRTTLGGKTIRFRSYEDGEAFLESDWYREGEAFFILLDRMMPKIDGIEVLKKIRQSYPKEGILISMLTARKSEAEVARALELGADDYMLKPFRVREIIARMERFVERVF
ncbi:response regulator [Alkalicoccus halolimnae]|uniref:Response regulator n=1 Tax=Alkalicoccus halolimnae TaxID=1667239 RepID=A0A5C7FQ31_9BACI|nr:response regulator [Alkalicoccus halolimnae]TXF86855.1 response regulator [Alkalicoccus halolimnae]